MENIRTDNSGNEVQKRTKFLIFLITLRAVNNSRLIDSTLTYSEYILKI